MKINSKDIQPSLSDRCIGSFILCYRAHTYLVEIAESVVLLLYFEVHIT